MCHNLVQNDCPVVLGGFLVQESKKYLCYIPKKILFTVESCSRQFQFQLVWSMINYCQSQMDSCQKLSEWCTDRLVHQGQITIHFPSSMESNWSRTHHFGQSPTLRRILIWSVTTRQSGIPVVNTCCKTQIWLDPHKKSVSRESWSPN